MPAPHTLTATEAVDAIASGRLSSVELVQSCLNRIAETDAEIKAWAYLDQDLALAQAAECDRIRKAGYATGRLHGVPVGLKDIVTHVICQPNAAHRSSQSVSPTLMLGSWNGCARLAL